MESRVRSECRCPFSVRFRFLFLFLPDVPDRVPILSSGSPSALPPPKRRNSASETLTATAGVPRDIDALVAAWLATRDGAS